jgi:hypothetical protein
VRENGVAVLALQSGQYVCMRNDRGIGGCDAFGKVGEYGMLQIRRSGCREEILVAVGEHEIDLRNQTAKSDRHAWRTSFHRPRSPYSLPSPKTE